MTDSKTAVEDLAAWLTAVWDEEETRAVEWQQEIEGEIVVPATLIGGIMDPWRELARIAADRKILARCMAIWSRYEEGGSLCELARAVDARLMMHDLASPYADRPDFPGETLVERQGVEQ